jgi:hypothetical protein
MQATPEGQPRSWPQRPTAEVRRSGAWPALLGVLGLLGAVVVGLVAHCLVRAWFAAHPVIEPVVSGGVSVRPPAWLILLSLGFYLLLLLLPVASVVSFVLAVAVSGRGGPDRPRLLVLGVLLTGLAVAPWWGVVRPDNSGVGGARADLVVAGLLIALLTGVLGVILLEARSPVASTD